MSNLGVPSSLVCSLIVSNNVDPNSETKLDATKVDPAAIGIAPTPVAIPAVPAVAPADKALSLKTVLPIIPKTSTNCSIEEPKNLKFPKPFCSKFFKTLDLFFCNLLRSFSASAI